MINFLNDEFGNLITVCPYCQSKNIIQFPIIDLFVYTNIDGLNLNSITLKKTLSRTGSSDEYIKSIIVNSLKHKPLMARIIITKPYYEVIRKLVDIGFLSNQDIKNLNE